MSLTILGLSKSKFLSRVSASSGGPLAVESDEQTSDGANRLRRSVSAARHTRPHDAVLYTLNGGGFRGGWCGNVEMPPDTSHPRRCWAFAAAVELRFLGRFRDRIEDQLVGVTGSGECRHQSPDPTAVR